jgi:hypothetical protein
MNRLRPRARGRYSHNRSVWSRPYCPISSTCPYGSIASWKDIPSNLAETSHRDGIPPSRRDIHLCRHGSVLRKDGALDHVPLYLIYVPRGQLFIEYRPGFAKGIIVKGELEEVDGRRRGVFER